MRWGFGAAIVVNLFALRSTDPAMLRPAHEAGVDSRGPENEAHLRAVSEAHTVVLAWGTRADDVEGPAYPAAVAAALARGRANLFHLGQCGNGAPKHPLYLAGDTPLRPWRPGAR